MGARWLAAVLFVAAVSYADEVGSAKPRDASSEPASHLRTFIGGFASGAFLVSRVGVFTVSPLGVAVDVGVNFRDHLAVFGQFRLSTMLLFNHAQAQRQRRVEPSSVLALAWRRGRTDRLRST